MKRRILITGATSGIGKALALTLVKKDNTLIISGRNSDALQKLKIELSPLCRDVYVVKADYPQA